MRAALALTSVLALGACAAPPPPAASSKIDHVVVLYLENRSFDNLYGAFPGANGRANAGAAAIQVDAQGKPYAVLPQVKNTYTGKPDTRFPAELANGPWPIDAYLGQDQKTSDLLHKFYQHQVQIDGGRNDRFVESTDSGALTMGYYDGARTELWQFAKDYTLADNFFQAAFGGSFLNHIWLACACSPRFDDAPAEIRAVVAPDGRLLKDGQVTPDGYAVNTIQPRNPPFDARVKDPARRVPPQTMATIGDRLSANGVSWAYFSGGWADADAGHPGELFQYHHQPYAFFAAYAPGTEARKQHLRDEMEFVKAVETGTLPAVSFVKPFGPETQHPGYADITSGDHHAAELLRKIIASPQWGSTAVIVTYDEFGGFWDHVAPPKGDRWGPGTRIPALIVSPLAKRNHVDHTVYDTTSILAFIEKRFGLEPLTDRDAKADPLSGAFRD